MLLKLHQIDKFYLTSEGPLHVLRGIDLSDQNSRAQPNSAGDFDSAGAVSLRAGRERDAAGDPATRCACRRC